ncbi:alanine racemase [Streptomyces hundungensis]|uniref:alanine racemase n=1 Tax=Streptomyces hundungensis TaxID=1077946 RepID=UPI0033C3FCBA
MAANTVRLRERTVASLMAVVGADGFGLGALDIARTALAHGTEEPGVVAAAEALELRRDGRAGWVGATCSTPTSRPQWWRGWISPPGCGALACGRGRRPGRGPPGPRTPPHGRRDGP